MKKVNTQLSEILAENDDFNLEKWNEITKKVLNNLNEISSVEKMSLKVNLNQIMNLNMFKDSDDFFDNVSIYIIMKIL